MSVEALVFTHQTILTDEEYDSEEEKATARKRLLAAPPRLFSAGLNAHIMEWDLNTLKAEVCWSTKLFRLVVSLHYFQLQRKLLVTPL